MGDKTSGSVLFEQELINKLKTRTTKAILKKFGSIKIYLSFHCSAFRIGPDQTPSQTVFEQAILTSANANVIAPACSPPKTCWDEFWRKLIGRSRNLAKVQNLRKDDWLAGDLTRRARPAKKSPAEAMNQELHSLVCRRTVKAYNPHFIVARGILDKRGTEPKVRVRILI